MGNHCRAGKMLKVGGADLQRPKHLSWPQQGGVYGEKQQVGLDGVMGMFYPPPPHVVLLECTFCKVKTNCKERKSAVLREKKRKIRSWQKDKGRQLKCSLKLRGPISLSKWPHLWRFPDPLKCLVRQRLSSYLILAKFMDP